MEISFVSHSHANRLVAAQFCTTVIMASAGIGSDIITRKMITEKYDFHLPLQWCYNGRDGVSNHQLHDCLLNRLFGCRSKKTSKPASLAFVSPVNSPHKWPVTRKMFPFDDVSMALNYEWLSLSATGSKRHPISDGDINITDIISVITGSKFVQAMDGGLFDP